MSGAGVPDFFYREAQRLGYVARSAFKLLQMQKQYQLINPGSSVLDLGCAPGAWLQVACQSLGPVENGGLVVGVDVKKVKVPSLCDSRVKTVCADVMNIPRAYLRSLTPKNNGFSVILSDMCPPVSGIRTKDSVISIKLGMRALDLALGDACLAHSDDETQKPSTSDGSGPAPDPGILQPGGHLIIKLLESEEIKELSQICKPLFRKASLLRPKATRPSSREIYLICQSYNIGRGR